MLVSHLLDFHGRASLKHLKSTVHTGAYFDRCYLQLLTHSHPIKVHGKSSHSTIASQQVRLSMQSQSPTPRSTNFSMAHAQQFTYAPWIYPPTHPRPNPTKPHIRLTKYHHTQAYQPTPQTVHFYFLDFFSRNPRVGSDSETQTSKFRGKYMKHISTGFIDPENLILIPVTPKSALSKHSSPCPKRVPCHPCVSCVCVCVHPNNQYLQLPLPLPSFPIAGCACTSKLRLAAASVHLTASSPVTKKRKKEEPWPDRCCCRQLSTSTQRPKRSASHTATSSGKWYDMISFTIDTFNCLKTSV